MHASAATSPVQLVTGRIIQRIVVNAREWKPLNKLPKTRKGPDLVNSSPSGLEGGARSIPWVLENPWSSRCWDLSPIRDLLSQQKAFLCREMPVNGH